MNNDLENLYGNNNEINNNIAPNNEETFNNIVNEPADLSSLYKNDNVMQVNEKASEENNNIGVNQEGLNKLYNQNTVDLDAEPTNNNPEPVVIKHKSPLPSGVKKDVVIEEDILVAYVGNNFEKIAGKPFNFAAFFFGILYLFYRKKLLYGLILFIIATILSRFMNTVLINIGMNIIIGAAFNTLYMYDAKAYVKNLKQKNPTQTNAELRDKCKKVGGTSIIYIIVGMVVSYIVGIVVAMFMIKLGFTNTNSNTNINLKDLINNKKTVYLGEVEKDKKIKIADKYTIEVPNEFEDKSDNTSEYNYSQDNCNFSLYKASKITDAKKLANEMSIYYLSVEDVKTTRINNINWYYVENQDGTDNQYHYVTSNNGEVYIFEYNTDSKDKACINSKDMILSTIKEK